MEYEGVWTSPEVFLLVVLHHETGNRFYQLGKWCNDEECELEGWCTVGRDLDYFLEGDSVEIPYMDGEGEMMEGSFEVLSYMQLPNLPNMVTT
jgi:hypothetical protein